MFFLQFSTLICVFTLDRIGRRWTLYWGCVGMCICCFLAGGFSKLTEEAQSAGNPDQQAHYGGAATFFVFLYTIIFGATWLTVPWLYPAEIFPLQVRARGNAWGVVGWSIGNGWTVCHAALDILSSKITDIFLTGFAATHDICTAKRTYSLHLRWGQHLLNHCGMGSVSRI